MSCFDVNILDPNINTIEIETCIGDQPSSIDIVTYDNISTVEINHCIALLPSEINELITVKDILAGSGISVSDSSGIYTISLLDPTISATGILDLLETVQDIIGNSGLLAGSFININYDDSTGYTTVSATGLQPSGNYSIVGHSHNTSDITNFNSSVSGLLPSVTGTGYVSSSFSNNLYTISVTGLQPSGNYSVDGHTHTSSNITDFNSSVSGLLPVKNINAGSGIGISSVSGDFTVSVTGTFGLTGEEVDDRVSGLLVAGTGINLSYNDLANSLSISTTGLQPSGNYSLVGHTHTSSQITDFNSAVSGILPTINNSGDNRILTSTGSSFGIDAESNLTFNSSLGLSVLSHSGSQQAVYNLQCSNTSISSCDFNFTATDSAGVQINYFPPSSIFYPNALKLTNTSGNILITSEKLGINNFSPTYTLDVNGSGNFNSLYVSGIPVSISGHTHSSSDITDFNSAVSGLIAIHNIVGKSGIQVSAVSGTTREIATNFIAGNGIAFNYNNDESLTISTITNNGLISINDNSTTLITIPSGYIVGSLCIYQNGVKLLDGIDYTATDGSGIILNIPPTSGSYIEYATPTINSNIQNLINASLSGLQPSGNYSIVGHTHISNEITNFSSSVSGLLPTISGSGYVLSSFANNIYTISVSGLQPSGNYSTVGHTHTANNITDFNNSVSGLLPSVSGSGYAVSSLSNNTYTISITGLQPSGNYSAVGHSHTTTDISNISTIYDTYIYDLGTLSGSVDINYATDRMIQTFNIDNNPITLTKGTGWPTSNISRDVLLQITCINPASITWSIVGNNWYNQPALSLPSGEYMVLLRAMGSGVIQGHYIGEKQGVL